MDAAPGPARRRRKPVPRAFLLTDTSEQRSWPLHQFASDHVEFSLRTWNMPEGDYAAVLATEAPEIARLAMTPEGQRSDRVIRLEALALAAVAPAVCLIERKSLSDLYGTVTHGRERFEDELQRMRPYGFRALVIESDLPGIIRGTEHSRATPQSVVASILAYQQRFGLHVVFGTDRRHAASYAYRLLERWVRDRMKGEHSEQAASDIF